MQKVETERATVYLVEEQELSGLKKYGRQMRAHCPVHHSRDRDLVLVPPNVSGYLSEEDEQRAGIGHCKSINCNAVVRVIEWNPDAASRLLGRKVKAGSPRYSITSQDEDQAEEWQQRELVALNKIYDTAISALSHSRCLAYLAQRGLGSEEALALLERLGIGYIPPVEAWKKPPPFELLKWCDRIIFPFTTRSGERGYIGRTLMLWTPEMDENVHKKLLNEYDARMEEEHGLDAGKYQIRRWRKTYRGGFFNADALSQHRHIVITEGTFDAIALMLAGLANVIAIAGTELDIEWLSQDKKLMEVTLALDTDTAGRRNTARIMDRVNGTGITAHACTPPDDGSGKDWSERYRMAGIGGLTPVLTPKESDEQLIGNPDQDIATDFVETMVSTPTHHQHIGNTLSTDEPLDQGEYEDPLNFCCKCGSLVDEIMEEAGGHLVGYCAEHLPKTSDPQDNPRASMVKPMERAPIQQWLVDYWIEHGELPDQWVMQRVKLEATGYYETFNATEQALLNRVQTPRTYPCPVPRYEWQEDERGVKHLIIVGYWEAST